MLFLVLLLLFVGNNGCTVALSSHFNGFSTFHLSFLLLLSSAGIFADELPRGVTVNASILFINSVINVKVY